MDELFTIAECWTRTLSRIDLEKSEKLLISRPHFVCLLKSESSSFEDSRKEWCEFVYDNQIIFLLRRKMENTFRYKYEHFYFSSEEWNPKIENEYNLNLDSVYTPYIPVFITPAFIAPDELNTRRGMLRRYAERDLINA